MLNFKPTPKECLWLIILAVAPLSAQADLRVVDGFGQATAIAGNSTDTKSGSGAAGNLLASAFFRSPDSVPRSVTTVAQLVWGYGLRPLATWGVTAVTAPEEDAPDNIQQLAEVTGSWTLRLENVSAMFQAHSEPRWPGGRVSLLDVTTGLSRNLTPTGGSSFFMTEGTLLAGHEYRLSLQTSAQLDGGSYSFDVLDVQVIPAPGACLLGLIGICLVAWLKGR